jgi:hypothetical protein
LGGKHGSKRIGGVGGKAGKAREDGSGGRADYGSVPIARSSTKTSSSPSPCRLPCLCLQNRTDVKLGGLFPSFPKIGTCRRGVDDSAACDRRADTFANSSPESGGEPSTAGCSRG